MYPEIETDILEWKIDQITFVAPTVRAAGRPFWRESRIWPPVAIH
jgi:hypothetical protein